MLVLLQKCQLFSEKLTRELSDSRAVLTESSLGLVLSTECGCDCSEQFQCKIFYWIVQLKHAGKGMFSPTPEVFQVGSGFPNFSEGCSADCFIFTKCRIPGQEMVQGRGWGGQEAAYSAACRK